MRATLLALCAAACGASAPSSKATPTPQEPQPRVDVYADPGGFTAPPLAIGDPAPPIVAAEWIGAPVGALTGKVHVVEFWATWCQPCQKSIPDLKRLARAHGDRLRVVGVAAAEAGDAAGVRAFAERAGIDYSLAYVEDAGVYERWMRAARVSGLPWVFVVDAAGRVAWWGQPFESEFEPAVRAALDGTTDLAETRRGFEDRQALDARGWPLQARALAAARQGRSDEALELLDQVIALDPVRFWFAVEVKFQLLLEKQGREAAYAYGRQIVAGASKDNPHALTDIGSAILEIPDAAARDLALAEQALARARELTRGENPDVLRAMARLRVLQGRRREALVEYDAAMRWAAPAEVAELAVERGALIQ